MGRYELVASYYNLKKGCYEDEVVVKVDGYDFSKLRNIDEFTLSNNKSSVFNMIRNQNDVGRANFLSIRYVDSNSEVYSGVLFDDKELLSCVDDLRLDKKRYTYYIDINNQFFKKEKAKLASLIENRDFEMINTLFLEKDSLKGLIIKYLNSFYEADEYDSRDKDLQSIFFEFSRYNVFRKWVINNKKLEEKGIVYNSCRKREVRPKSNVSGKIVSIRARFLDDDVIIDREEFLRNYNINNEEFIEDDEIDMMGIIPSSSENSELIGDIKRKINRR